MANHQQREALARKALAIDPTSLHARASLAISQWLLAFNFSDELGLEGKGRDLLFAEAAAEAKQVLARDPDQVGMHYVLASDAQNRGDIDTARKIYERALEIDPRNSATYLNLGAMLIVALGRPQEAREVLLKALQLPSYLPPAMTYGALSEVASVQGQYDEAIAWGERSVQANPNHGVTRAKLAIAYAMKGDERRARGHGRTAPAPPGLSVRRFRQTLAGQRRGLSRALGKSRFGGASCRAAGSGIELQGPRIRGMASPAGGRTRRPSTDGTQAYAPRASAGAGAVQRRWKRLSDSISARTRDNSSRTPRRSAAKAACS